MLSAASSSGAHTPLSPLTQSTLEKHLPGLKPKRFLQKKCQSTVDVACITGNLHLRKISFELVDLFFLKVYYALKSNPKKCPECVS